MLPYAEYLASLPKRHVGCAAIFLNEKDELLIVKQSYREGWSVPGGVIDALESPHDGCVREIKEEIGLEEQEIEAYQFCSQDEALKLLRPTIGSRVRAGLEAMRLGVPLYTEYESH